MIARFSGIFSCERMIGEREKERKRREGGRERECRRSQLKGAIDLSS